MGLNCVCENLFIFLKLVSEPKMSSSASYPSKSLTLEFVAQHNVKVEVNKETHIYFGSSQPESNPVPL